jgi:REP element-mobilizing transposase RayT
MPDTPQTLRFFRDRLPHWLVADHPYFVTICRKDCLPASVFADLSATRADRPPSASSRPGATSPASWFDSFHRLDTILNAAKQGPRDLTTPAIAQTLFDSFDWLRDRGWKIWAGCIMPSHLHLVMRNTQGRNALLTEDLGLFKNYTGRVANQWRGVEGDFWQRECFDHWCRDDEDWLGYVQYTACNPVKANLVKAWRAWRWTVVDPELEPFIDEYKMPGS